MINSFLKKFTALEKVVLLLVLLIYFNNIFIDIMQVDAAQYAGISAEMSQTHSYLEVKELQQDYLDKPPLLFWISSIGISLFGENNFGYKIASFIFLLLSLYSLYRFTRLFYSEKVSKNAMLILATSQSYFLMTNDVRTDALLTSCVISSIWLLSEYFENRKLKYLILGSVFIGLGMLSKGPIALIAILFPLGINLIYQKKWKDIFHWHWFLVLFIIALLLIPMSYGLYTQFDSHPEKGKSGLYFFYWLQSFGRITGENTWNNGAPWHFFLGSSIWDFFPWIFPLYFSLFYFLKKLFLKVKFTEITTLVGLVSVFTMLSLSKYKLPHYVFVTFPFAAVITSVYLSDIDSKKWKNWFNTYYILGILFFVIILSYPFLFFIEFNFAVIVCILVQLSILILIKKQQEESIGKLFSCVIVLNLFLSFVFYPKLLTFQADSMAAKWAVDNIKNEKIHLYESPSNSFNFYSKNPFNSVISHEELEKVVTPCWIYIEEEKLDNLKKLKFKIIENKEFNFYPITRLKLKFLLSNSRPKELHKKHLIKISN
jgi:4-amino-4-deoxy-L-arabinose transferase-like glycosyltransferase